MNQSIASASIIAMKSRSEHGVAFYESEQHLYDIMASHLARPLRSGHPVLIVARAEHLETCLSTLSNDSIDIEGARASGQLATYDANETLGKLLVDGNLDTGRFEAVIAGPLKEAAGRHKDLPLYVFGEMVDILWRAGRHDLALRLEELWNGLGQEFSFNLLCAYYMGSFADDSSSAGFDHICAQHDNVKPTEGFTDIRDERARLREIAMLQQRALALEAEIRRCKAAEAERDRLLIREKAAREEAETANRIKDEFLAVLSHELRTPLNAIVGWTQILGKHREERTIQKAVETIHRNALLQKRLVEDLLDVSRITAGKLTIQREPVELNTVVMAAVESVRLAAATRQITLKVETPPSAVKVSGDADRLQQVVWNLLSNAVKFTPPAGRVTVRLERSNSTATISVSDTGEGIPPDFLPHVFDRFRQADGSATRSHGGLGVGLAIVRSLIEAHGGRVSASSPGVGCGATFEVTLPSLPE